MIQDFYDSSGCIAFAPNARIETIAVINCSPRE